MIAKEQIAEARALHAASTQGEWSVRSSIGGHIYCDDHEPRVLLQMNTHFPYAADVAAIAWSHNNLPALLDEIERLRGEVGQLKSRIDATIAEKRLAQIDAESIEKARRHLVVECEAARRKQHSAEQEAKRLRAAAAPDATVLTLHCNYCGATAECRNDQETARAMSVEHGKTCAVHPMREVERLRAAIMRIAVARRPDLAGHEPTGDVLEAALDELNAIGPSFRFPDVDGAFRLVEADAEVERLRALLPTALERRAIEIERVPSDCGCPTCGYPYTVTCAYIGRLLDGTHVKEQP